MKGWIGVDFDGTLAKYEKWVGPEHCGEPVMPMVEMVRGFLAAGTEVRIFTARIYPLLFASANNEPAAFLLPDSGIASSADRLLSANTSINTIREFCMLHFGKQLDITCMKDFGMMVLYDDRCVQVEANTGLCDPWLRNRATTFEQAWALKEAQGYRYGTDALKQVRFGWRIARGEA